MHLIQVEGGTIEFKIDSTSASKEMKVANKYPGDERVLGYLAEWKSPVYTHRTLRGEISDLAWLISFGGLILLALASIIPFGLHNGWNSWTLYTPLIALMLGIVYEMNIGNVWR